jgi:hypothetical protein
MESQVNKVMQNNAKVVQKLCTSEVKVDVDQA